MVASAGSGDSRGAERSSTVQEYLDSILLKKAQQNNSLEEPNRLDTRMQNLGCRTYVRVFSTGHGKLNGMGRVWSLI